MQISANFSKFPSRQSISKSIPPVPRLGPSSWKAAPLDNGGSRPTTSGWKNLFLDFLAFFSPKGHFRCANVLRRKPMWPFYACFKIIMTIHIFAFIHLWPPSSGSLCHLSETPQQIERSSDLPSPPATARLTTGWPGWPCWSRRPTQTYMPSNLMPTSMC